MIELDRRERRLTAKVIRAGSFLQPKRCSSPSGCGLHANHVKTGGSTLTANSVHQGWGVAGQASLCRQRNIRVTAVGGLATRPAGPQAKLSISVTEMVSTQPLQVFN